MHLHFLLFCDIINPYHDPEKHMKKILTELILILILTLILASCAPQSDVCDVTEDTTAWLNMNTSYSTDPELKNGEGKTARVIILLGQSNATGCSLNSYLEKNVPAEDYAKFLLFQKQSRRCQICQAVYDQQGDT